MPNAIAHAALSLEFLEAAYAWELEDEAWLRGLVEAAVQVWGRPRWACAHEYDASDAAGFRFARPVFWGDTGTVRQLVLDGLARVTPDMAQLFRTLSVGFGRPVGGVDDRAGQEMAKLETVDYFAINGLDGTGRGCFIGIGAERTRLATEELMLFQRLAYHLASAYRCRRRLRARGASPIDDSEAVLRPDGHLLDASGPAQPSPARQGLAAAVRSMEGVRGRSTRQESTERWRPRVSGRWTLVDAYDRAGERFIVARENLAAAPGLDTLTQREQQVVVSAVSGKTNKDIAYELGISHATARVLLSRAYARLGVRSRRELLALPAIRALLGQRPAP